MTSSNGIFPFTTWNEHKTDCMSLYYICFTSTLIHAAYRLLRPDSLIVEYELELKQCLFNQSRYPDHYNLYITKNSL
jgi:hypothetical protein